jgi:hypothetical protein
MNPRTTSKRSTRRILAECRPAIITENFLGTFDAAQDRKLFSTPEAERLFHCWAAFLALLQLGEE